jgi:MFS family permease
MCLIGWIPILFSQGLPLWLLIILFGAVGFASSAIVVGFAFVKESVPVVSAGIVTGVCNMGMEMGPTILQPVIGWVLDLKWNGISENGIRIYDLNAYQVAFGVMIGLSLIGALIIPFARETYCRQLEE